MQIDTPENLEKKTEEKNVILLTVEDSKDNMSKLKKDIPEMLDCKLIKDNEDGTKQYMIESNANVDLRKQLFDILPKKEITIFELKKAEKSLEDAFITLIDKNTINEDKKQEKAPEKKRAKRKDKEEKKSKENKEKKGGKK